MPGSSLLSCCQCKAEKPTSEFTPRADRPRGYAYHCKACQVERTKASAERHREQYLERKRQRYQENAEKLRQKAIARYHNNREASRAANQAWKSANKVLVRAYNNARKRSLRDASPEWADFHAIQEVYTLAANWNDIWPEDPVHVDHIIPLNGQTVCGLHVQTNLQILRAEDNMRKRNRLMLDISMS